MPIPSAETSLIGRIAQRDQVEDVLILERRTQVIATLDQLPVEQRQVIELAYYKQRTNPQ